MKSFIMKLVVVLTLVISSYVVLTTKNKTVDYPMTQGNSLSDNPISKSSFLTKLTTPVTQYDMTIPERFAKKIENNYLELYLEESTMAIAIKDKSNGYVWYSYDVENNCLIETCEGDSTNDVVKNRIRSGVNMVTLPFDRDRTLLDPGVKIIYKFTQDGFVASIDFTRIMIKFDVSVKLEGKDLVVSIPRESLEEYDPKLWTPQNSDVLIKNIQVFPFLGAVEQKENGYIVIPDGSGAIVSLKETPKYAKSYSQQVYGEDLGYKDAPDIPTLKSVSVKPLSRITVPIYGVIHDTNNTGLLVISEEGDNYAMYNYKAKGVLTSYYQSYFEYIYRKDYNQYQSRSNDEMSVTAYQAKPNMFNVSQRYVFLSGNQANYVGVAKNYRSYLENNQQFSSQTSQVSERSTKIDIIGNEVTMGIFKQVDVTTTSYDEAVDLIKQIKADGFNDLDVTFKTYSRDDSAYRFDVYKNLGGKKDLNSMINYFNKNDIDFSYYTNYVETYENNRKYTATMLNKRAISELALSYMSLYKYINKAKYFDDFAKEEYSEYSDYSINSLSIDGLDRILYTQNDKDKIRYSQENIKNVTDALDWVQSKGVQTNLYNPDAYLYRYTDKYYEAPISSSELMFTDASIPLIQLIVGGHMEMYSDYLNFISSETDTLLRLVEFGINPSYVLTSRDVYKLKYSNSSDIYISQYASLSERMKNYDLFIKEALDAVNGKEMLNHEYIASGVVKTEYDNGVTLIINYNNEDYVYNNETTIIAKGYGVIWNN